MDIIHIKVKRDGDHKFHGEDVIGVQPTIKSMEPGDVLLFPIDYVEACYMSKSWLVRKWGWNLRVSVKPHDFEKVVKVERFENTEEPIDMNMTPETYKQKKEAFYNKMKDLEQEMDDLRERHERMTETYAFSVLAKSGHFYGERITDEKGRVWFVSGAHVVSDRVKLSLNPAKKNGTMSKQTFIARGEPDIFLN